MQSRFHGSILYEQYRTRRGEREAHDGPYRMREIAAAISGRSLTGRRGQNLKGRLLPRQGVTLSRFRKAPAEYGLVTAARNFKDQRLPRAVQRKVGLNALSQLGRIHPNDV